MVHAVVVVVVVVGEVVFGGEVCPEPGDVWEGDDDGKDCEIFGDAKTAAAALAKAASVASLLVASF